MHVFRFREFGLKTAIHAPKLFLGEFWPSKWGAMWKIPKKGTSLLESASFEPSCVKIRRRVWPVGEFPKKTKIILVTHVPRSPPWTDMYLIWHSRSGRRRNHQTVTNFLVIGWETWWVSILWAVENCHFPLTKAVAVNTGLALPRRMWWGMSRLPAVFRWPQRSQRLFNGRKTEAAEFYT